MSLALSEASKLRPEIRLAQAISNFEAALQPNHQPQFKVIKSRSPPTFRSVIELTNELGRDGERHHGRFWKAAFGPRLEPLLHRIQMFTKAGDVLIGGSQNLIASGVWACVRLFLQVSIGYLAFFDRLTMLWERIGRTAMIHQELSSLFPRSQVLQSYMCEYLIVIVDFCRKAASVSKKSVLSQLASSFAATFDEEFKNVEENIEQWSICISQKVLALATNTHLENSVALARQTGLLESLRQTFQGSKSQEWRVALLRALSPSQTEFDSVWRRESKKGQARWILKEEAYSTWKTATSSTTLLVNGSLGSGKTVLLANVVRDVYDHPEDERSKPVVASFFCQHQLRKSLKAEIILGSIMHQILRSGNDPNTRVSSLPFDLVGLTETICDVPAFLKNLPIKLPTSQQYFVVVDALDECLPHESETVITGLKDLSDAIPLHVALTFRTGFQPPKTACLPHPSQISMSSPAKDHDIAEYIEKQFLARGGLPHVAEGVEQRVKEVLKACAQGMYLWVRLQLDSIMPPHGEGIVSAKDIASLLDDLPLDLPQTFNRAISKIEDKRFGSRIFQLVAAAERPLSVTELQVALNVHPQDLVWNSSTLVINPRAAIWRCGGGLLEVDDADDGVGFIHHSALRHLLVDPALGPRHPTASAQLVSGPETFPFSLDEANMLLGIVCLVYLNLEIHDRRVVKQGPELSADSVLEAATAAVSASSSSRQRVFKVLTRSLGRSHDATVKQSFDVGRTLQYISAGVSHSQPVALAFMSYAADYWLAHTRELWPGPDFDCGIDAQRLGTLFRRLLYNAPHIKRPWDDGTASSMSALKWSMSQSHIAIFEASSCTVSQSTIDVLKNWNATIDPNKPMIMLNRKFLGHVLSKLVFMFFDSTRRELGISLISQLLSAGADPNVWANTRDYDHTYLFVDCMWTTPLAMAIQSAHSPELVHSLLHHGADPNISVTYKGQLVHPLLLATGACEPLVKEDRIPLTYLLLRHGACLHEPVMDEAVGAVIKSDDFQVLKYFYLTGAILDRKIPDDDHLTNLFASNHIQKATFRIDYWLKDSCIFVSDLELSQYRVTQALNACWFSTPRARLPPQRAVIRYCFTSDKKVARLATDGLLNHFGNKSAESTARQPYLTTDETILSFLLDCGADLGQLPPDSIWAVLPLLRAVTSGTVAEVEWLLTGSPPVDPNWTCPLPFELGILGGIPYLIEGSTPIEVALSLQRQDMVELLLEYGARYPGTAPRPSSPPRL